MPAALLDSVSLPAPRTPVSRPAVYSLLHCRIEIRPDQRRLRLVYWDRAALDFVPPNGPTDIELAERLGYGQDVFRLAADRLVLYVFLAERLNRSWSSWLWSLAHNTASSEAAIRLEHDRLAAFHAYLCLGEEHAALAAITREGVDLRWLAIEARVFLDTGYSQPSLGSD